MFVSRKLLITLLEKALNFCMRLNGILLKVVFCLSLLLRWLKLNIQRKIDLMTGDFLIFKKRNMKINQPF